MTSRNPIPVPLLLAAAVVLSGVLAAWMFFVISRPAHLERCLAVVVERINSVPRLRSPISSETRWSAKDFCDGPADKFASAFEHRVSDLTAAHGVKVEQSVATPSSSSAAGLSSIQFSLKGSAGFDQTIGLLRAFDAEQPAVFVRRMDVIPHGEQVTLQLEGSIWCRPSV